MLPAGYKISENLFSNNATRVFRGIQEKTKTPVIMRTCGESEASAGQYTRLAFTHELLELFNHPNIVKTIDWTDNPVRPWLIMEDINGCDLWAFAEAFENKQIPTADFLKIGIQLADAMSVIHHAQVLHKDLHPGNIVVNPETMQVQIIDFGLASLLSREQPVLKSPEALEGLLPYISPEQTGRMNRALDYRTDFYTIGVTFFELLTGQPPFQAEDALGLVYAHLAQVQPPVHELREDIPLAISAIIDKLLNKNAEDRYQSALGLKHDLQKCLDDLNECGAITSFKLAMQDVSEHFQIPQILYGRSKETSQLLAEFQTVLKGEPKLLTIAGYSGIGKSTLVNEIHKPIAAHNGLFLSGKFEQYQQNAPYSALKIALKSWIQIKLRVSDSQLQLERKALLQALGSNARVLVDFMPEMAQVLGELAPLPTLGATETQARFHLICQRFFKVATRQKPWVLFLDDLQWSDQGTLNLIPELLAETDTQLLIIGAYRDNAVDLNHPLTALFERVSVYNDNKLVHVKLGPLPKEEVTHLLVDTLHRSTNDIAPLAQLIFEKAGGNPFFTVEFLKSLYTQALLNFDLEAQHWTWNIEAIEDESITDNVVNLLLHNMQLLPSNTQSLLKLAACIGTRFDLHTLAIVSGLPAGDVANQLWPALKAGLIVQLAGYCPLGASSSDKAFNASYDPDDGGGLQLFRFIHDRMLQAAYSSLSELEQTETHLVIGRLIYEHATEEEKGSKLFEILEHLNNGSALITNNKEAIKLAELNAVGAEKARFSSVWEGAAGYARKGLAALKKALNNDQNAMWHQHYQLCFRLHDIGAECEYLCGNVASAEALYNTLETQTTSNIDKARQYALRATQHMGRGEFKKALELCITGLHYVGVTFPETEKDWNNHLHTQRQQLNDAFKSVPLEQLHTLPEDQDPQSQIESYLLTIVAGCALLQHKNTIGESCVIGGISRFVERGKNDLLPSLLTFYGILAHIKHDDYETADKAGAQALHIKSLYPHCREGAAAINGVALGSYHLKHNLNECVQLYLQGYREGLQNGELTRAGVCLAGVCHTQTAAFIKPKELVAQCDRALLFARKNRLTLFAAIISKQYALSLQKNQFLLKDENFEPAIIEKIKNSFFIGFLNIIRFNTSFFMGMLHPLSSNIIASINQQFSSFESQKHMVFTKDFYCLFCLFYLKSKKDEAFLALDDNQQSLFFNYFTTFKQRLLSLTEFYAPNHEHKYLLVKAEELASNNGDFKQIVSLYKQAASSAADNDFDQYAALAYEHYADYLSTQGLEDLAEQPIKKAYHLYHQWQCQPKIDNLPKRYHYLKSVSHSAQRENISSDFSSPSSGSQSRHQSQLDFASVVKSSQAISGELGLDSLLERVMAVIMENAGAQLGVLILNEQAKPDGEPLIQAIIDILRHKKSFLSSIPLSKSKELPRSLIKQTIRSRQAFHIGRFEVDNEFAQDPYFQYKTPKSILCQPVIYRDKLIGVLYLESNLVNHAFTDERVEIIQTLLAQAAISFENARLFSETTLLNENLEQKVIERTQALEKANADIRSFNYTVSHDLRSPLRSLKNYSEILLEDYAPILDGEAKALLKRIHQRAQTMSELVNGLLDLSRVQGQELHRQKVSLTDLVNNTLDQLRQEDPARRVECEVDKNVMVTADKRMMSSLIDNLIGNAWKYTSKTPEAKITFHAEYQKGQQVYVVRDNGAGFNMAHAKDLFGTFKRMHSDKQFSGTGIGLATVKKIIQRHRGDIWAEAEVNKGAAFYFTLPG